MARTPKPLRHKASTEARKEARKAERKAKRVWSANRPKPASADPEIGSLVQQLSVLVKDGSVWEQADQTGLCESTIRRYRKGEVYEPRFRTLQMIARARGGRMVFVKD